MKTKVITLFLSAMVISFAGYCQGGQGKQGGRKDFDPEEQAKKNTEAMKERLQLTEEQHLEVEKINLVAAKKMKYTYDNAMGDRDAMRSALMKVNDETNKELKAVLNDEQWKEYELMQKERRERALRGPMNVP